MNEFEKGFLLGVLVGEGHFGGDGKQPQVTLRMHIKHERLFNYFNELIPGSKLYGPYSHSGRNYYQLMVRGKALREFLVPLLNSMPMQLLDDAVFDRYEAMKQAYELYDQKSAE